MYYWELVLYCVSYNTNFGYSGKYPIPISKFHCFYEVEEGTAFQLFEEWKKLTDEERGVWGMRARMMNRDMDLDRKECLI